MGETNVFGEPITGGNRVERAQKAANHPNVGGKRDKAVAYVKSEKENYGNGTSTLCIFYNATGETLYYTQDHDWYGKTYNSYPMVVHNGQWGGYLHVKKDGVRSGSSAGVEYRGKFNKTTYCKQMFSWDTPWNQATENNKAYCDIYEDDKDVDWDDVYYKMEKNGRQHVARWNGLITTVKTEEASSPLYEAKLTIEDYMSLKCCLL